MNPDRFIWHLDLLQELLPHIRSKAIYTAAGPSMDTKVDRSLEARLPFHVEAMDDSDLLYSTLVEFAEEIAEKLHNPKAIRIIDWRIQGGIAGFHGLHPHEYQEQLNLLIGWVRTKATIVEQLSLGDSTTYFCEQIQNFSRKYPRAPKPKRPPVAECPLCLEHQVRVLWAAAGNAVVKCQNCGYEIDPTDHPELAELQVP